MNKSTNKQNNYNSQVVNRLAEKWGVTKQYVRMCLRGDRTSETSDTIKKQYKQLVQEVEKILNQ